VSGVAGGTTLFTEGFVGAVALGDVGIGPGVVADSASSAAVADHCGRWGPWMAVFAAGEEYLGDHQ